VSDRVGGSSRSEPGMTRTSLTCLPLAGGAVAHGVLAIVPALDEFQQSRGGRSSRALRSTGHALYRRLTTLLAIGTASSALA
jgi:hypothetical protein